ncbi:uncharacterized protein LOC106880644 isoform X2 [Octopus bimaculoides]|uniref:Uncharacterized protein n=1 Tax=Octopus bimaculoides TaxID=37653 RepID=A0A0L8FXV7_OCTBM|nr:uncharacterized protein LOC106880644 isoform X2 [Octopus bimaculoides]|eukprot:XP_014786171.1 PREDICTED: uncharacterized protein LOC106880644 isoform X2 [Octopus bimaculoides]
MLILKMLAIKHIFNYSHRLKIFAVLLMILIVGIIYLNMNMFSENVNLIHLYKVTKQKHQGQFCTIFTSWTTRKDKAIVHNNTLHLWTQLGPDIQLVLFTNESILAQEALALGWKVLPILHVACGNLPVLKSMFLDVQRNFPSKVYGYANSDILFDSTLNTTLRSILKHEQFYQNHGFLITGRRTNVNFHNLTVKSIRNLSKVASKGSLARIWGEDYFFTGTNFPWSTFPNMVIGRVAFDNYIIIFGNINKACMIDTTMSILAVHQTTSDGNLASSKRPNAKCNTKLIKPQKYRQGYTDCIPLETRYDFQGIVQIIKRTTPPLCH